VDWEQIQDLNFKLALLAPHHPVALWRFDNLIGSWSSLLIRHFNAFTSIVEERWEGTDKLLEVHKQKAEKLYNTLSGLKKNLQQRVLRKVENLQEGISKDSVNKDLIDLLFLGPYKVTKMILLKNP